MFFLDKAWLIPLIPALSFVVILLFGKRMPRHGSEVGVGLAIVLLIYRNLHSADLDDVDALKG